MGLLREDFQICAALVQEYLGRPDHYDKVIFSYNTPNVMQDWFLRLGAAADQPEAVNALLSAEATRGLAVFVADMIANDNNFPDTRSRFPKDRIAQTFDRLMENYEQRAGGGARYEP